MHILDRRHKDILKLERKYAFSALCCNGQCIDVWIPPGDLIGRIREQFSLFRTVFVIENDVGDILYRFNGFPRYMWNSFLPSETEFTILGVDDKQQTVHGTIRRCWQTDTCIYTQIIDFTNRDMNIKHKALFIAASILLVSNPPMIKLAAIDFNRFPIFLSLYRNMSIINQNIYSDPFIPRD